MLAQWDLTLTVRFFLRISRAASSPGPAYPPPLVMTMRWAKGLASMAVARSSKKVMPMPPSMYTVLPSALAEILASATWVGATGALPSGLRMKGAGSTVSRASGAGAGACPRSGATGFRFPK